MEADGSKSAAQAPGEKKEGTATHTYKFRNEECVASLSNNCSLYSILAFLTNVSCLVFFCFVLFLVWLYGFLLVACLGSLFSSSFSMYTLCTLLSRVNRRFKSYVSPARIFFLYRPIRRWKTLLRSPVYHILRLLSG